MKSIITRILIFVLVLSLMVVSTTIAQPPDTLWTRTFGGDSTDKAYSVQQTEPDRGYIIAGYTRSYGAGESDVWLIKTDANGNQQWARTFGGNYGDEGRSVQQTTDGGYIIAGHTTPYGAGNEDILLIKTDALGNQQWNRTFGGSSDDYGRSVQQTEPDGGYIITGHTGLSPYYDVLLIKTDANGNQQWNRTFGGSGSDGGRSVQQTTDGGYVIAGHTWSFGAGEADFWLIKTDVNGAEQWNRTFGGSSYDYGKCVQQTTDGGYVIAGDTFSFGAGDRDVWLIKTNANGDSLWTRTFGGSNGDYGNSVQQTEPNGGYIIAGATCSYGAGYSDVWVIKTNDSGDSLWTRTFGGSNGDYGNSFQQTDDGGYIIAGYTGSYGAGYYDHDVYLIRLASETSVELDPVHHPYEFVLRPPYPNPFNPATTISYDVPITSWVRLNIYNLLGQRITTIADHQATPGSYSAVWDAGELPSGIYLCRMETKNFNQVKKLLLLK